MFRFRRFVGNPFRVSADLGSGENGAIVTSLLFLVACRVAELQDRSSCCRLTVRNRVQSSGPIHQKVSTTTKFKRLWHIFCRETRCSIHYRENVSIKITHITFIQQLAERSGHLVLQPRPRRNKIHQAARTDNQYRLPCSNL
jgi:hypothetical protein